MVTDVFKEALLDYFFLLNRGYPEKAAVKLVGDRYRLNSLERITLYRGITSKRKASQRKAKITHDLKGKKLYIDGYNVLFSMMNYLLGKLIFIGNDGLLRDCGEVYGRVENETHFYRAVDLLIEYIVECEVSKVEIYLDSPVSGSALHVSGIEKRLAEKGLKGEVFLVQSADETLKEKREGIFSTSDSEIIDCADCQVTDLARAVLELKFGAEILDLGTLL